MGGKSAYRAAVALLEVGDGRVLRGLAGAGHRVVVEAVRAAVEAVGLHAELAAVARFVRLGRLVLGVRHLRRLLVLRLGVCVDVHRGCALRCAAPSLHTDTDTDTDTGCCTAASILCLRIHRLRRVAEIKE